MPDVPRMTVTQALFGELPESVKARYGFGPGGAPQTPKTVPEAKKAAMPPGAGGGPASPWRLSRASWLQAGKRVVQQISADRVTSVAGGVTFFALLALFPAITALVSIYGLFADRDAIVGTLDTLDSVMPAEATGIIRGQIESITSAPAGALGLATAIGLLTALWSANGGVKALIDALNIAWFQRESRGFVKLNLVSLGFTIGAIIVICLLIALIGVLPAVIAKVSMGPVVDRLLSFARWPVMLLVLLGALAALYRWGPDKDEARWHWISPGAIFATIGLIAASVLFSWYASSFADYNKTYGSLGAVIGLMMWMWIAAIVVMTGAEINSEVERQIQMENGIPLEDRPAGAAHA